MDKNSPDINITTGGLPSAAATAVVSITENADD